MNEKNFEYLRDQLKYTGFGEALEMELKEKLKQGEPSFTLYHETYTEDRVARATLSFNKAKDTDMYFFNSYRLEMQKEDITEALEHTFYIGKGANITMKEAQNLLQGRAVNKDLTSREGQPYNAWLQMDLKQGDDQGNFKLQHYHQNYGYDLEATLAQYPIKELGNQLYKEDLMRSLKKGNLQGATFLKEGQEIRYFIQADPQFKTIIIYDADQKKMDNKLCKDLNQIEVQYEHVGEIKKKSQSENPKESQEAKQTTRTRQNRSHKL
ncbi:hypothetical protein [Flavobacterium sp. JAS]|uniref:hypothetical protein n=1 Tax=Flavobacterium sp. JAS TaxID=2897329 RepID=UPI001E442585|nr:hypothetical protein [Flavobacterium sp. JAS]MCD0470596.1 hypothetical protein [Flavobacterium sp. JAS]